MASVFTIRDGMADVIIDGAYTMTPTASALLWFLLFNGIYDPGSRWYGYVNVRLTKQETLASIVCRDRMTVNRALAELERLGFIKRKKRYTDTGQRLTDSIKLCQPEDFCFVCRTRGHKDVDDVCPEGNPRANENDPQ